NVSRDSWADHARMRADVCDFQPEWPAGSKLQYHGRSAHLTLAMVIEAVTKRDFREVIRERVIGPLGLIDELFVGVPPEEQQRCADVYAPPESEARDNSPEFREAGLPHGGGGDLGAWRGRPLPLLGRPNGGRVLRLAHQLRAPRSLALRPP